MQPRQARSSAIEDTEAATVTLTAVFQILTVCCLFFAVLRVSPVAALVGTLLLAPAMIRTAWISIQFRRRNLPFGLASRLAVFAASIGAVLMSVLLASVVFVSVLVVSSFFGLLLGLAVSGPEFYLDSAVAGVIGGLIGALAAGSIAFCYTMLISWVKSDFEI